MNEAQAFDLNKMARRLRSLIGQVEHDYQTLVRGKLIKVLGGLTECENLPIFLDLAEELAGDVLKLSDELLEAFD